MTYAIVFELDADRTATEHKFDNLLDAKNFVQTTRSEVIIHIVRLGKNVPISELRAM
ncbi:hypothetical protein [Brucella intermedia]|uniref:Uncharacterized protein n=1 Tax=Brucella intermedia 229E TaxID=1337887 RepID=U4VAP7_9HYPH|nr:hypothetical protein [Brucella intermedia]ERL99780.1 hypothetical protein Q644_09100 [Brucella intermedia 229E]